jgi:hypothetical protein
MKASLLILSVLVLLSGCAFTSRPANPALSRPSVAETNSLIFAGKTFVLKYQTDGQIPLKEYFLPEESVDAWSDMADFRVAPPLLNDLEPVDLANRAALLHQQDYPLMTVQLNTDDYSGVTTMMLFYPSSLRKDGRFSEFSIFKFYKDSATGQNITFHFARNIPVATPEAERDLEKNLRKLQQEVLPAMARFPLYRP